MELQETFLRLALALGIGLIIGVERGRHERSDKSIPRVGGLRTFSLSSLAGGLSSLLASYFLNTDADITAGLVLLIAFVGNAAPFLTMRAIAAPKFQDFGATTIIASQLVFLLSAIAILGDMHVAAAGGVTVAFILWAKRPLHAVIDALTEQEIDAALRFLGMSTILLPLLPNRSIGPYGAINPFEIGLMVVLVSGVSFLGYAALRLSHRQQSGLMLAAAAGGFVSSTAVTLTFSRRAKEAPELTSAFAAGIGIAGLTMWIRMIIVASVAAPMIGPQTAILLSIPTLTAALVSWRQWTRVASSPVETAPVNPDYPFDLALALKFAGLLVIVGIAVEALQTQIGANALYGLAFVTGLADVDAATLSFSRSAARASIPEISASIAILVVGLSNTLTKSVIAFVTTNRQQGLRLAAPLLASIGASLLAFILALIFLHT